VFDPDAGWSLSEQVSVRPEPFGALLYHFGTRKLSFLKDRTLLSIVTSLADSPSARAACVSVGVADEDQSRYLQALRVLAESRMIEQRSIEERVA
jgi:putative mycofactocin binding protein MftB